MTTFYSKRNNVVGWDRFVCKRVQSKELARKEAKRLQQLYSHSVAVPKVILQFGKRILMQNVPSITLVEHIEVLEQLPLNNVEVTQLAQKLCDWLNSYYQAVNWQKSRKILNDVNCRNFLITAKGTLYGVDFEMDCTGSRAQNIGQILAFVSTYDPTNTPLKRLFCATFLEIATKQMDLMQEEIEKYCLEELAAIALRRKKTQ